MDLKVSLPKYLQVLALGDIGLGKTLQRYVPFLPASLPSLLFCRRTKLVLDMDVGGVLSQEQWEAMLQDEITLRWMANDIKIIGELSSPTREHHSSLVLSFRDINRVFWTACNSECAPQPLWMAHQERQSLQLWC